MTINNLQEHKDAVAALSKLNYPREAIPKIVSIIEAGLKSGNPKVKENALKFYHVS